MELKEVKKDSASNGGKITIYEGHDGDFQVIATSLVYDRAAIEKKIGKPWTTNLDESVRGMADNIKRNCNETLRNAVVPTTIRFPRKMMDLPFDMQCTACRGQVIIATDDDCQLVEAKKMARFFNIIKNLPYIKLINKILSESMSSFMSESFQVSYSGQSHMGAAEPYVDAVLIDYDAPAAGIFLEMTAVNHSMMICFAQKWEEDVYVNAFMEELKKLGVSAEIIEKGHPAMPSVYSIFNE